MSYGIGKMKAQGTHRRDLLDCGVCRSPCKLISFPLIYKCTYSISSQMRASEHRSSRLPFGKVKGRLSQRLSSNFASCHPNTHKVDGSLLISIPIFWPRHLFGESLREFQGSMCRESLAAKLSSTSQCCRLLGHLAGDVFRYQTRPSRSTLAAKCRAGSRDPEMATRALIT